MDNRRKGPKAKPKANQPPAARRPLRLGNEAEAEHAKMVKALVKEELKPDHSRHQRKHLEEYKTEGAPPQHKKKLLDEVLDDWELMLLAKHSPGTIDAPFVQQMGVSTIRTGIITSQFSVKEAWDHTSSALQPVGTSDYVVIFYSPSQSVAYGTGNQGHLPSSSKRSGFSIM
jgi:hypothetical protein